MKSVVITGASTGIGWATAKLLIDKGYRVFGSVRKPADAERLVGEFGGNFVPLLFDVTDEAAVLASAREVRAALKGETLAGLVNSTFANTVYEDGNGTYVTVYYNDTPVFNTNLGTGGVSAVATATISTTSGAVTGFVITNPRLGLYLGPAHRADRRRRLGRGGDRGHH